MPAATYLLLGQAKEQEGEYNWMEAAESYREAIGLVAEHDFSKKGEICERTSYAFYRAAMQAEKAEEFRERMREAVTNYEMAKDFYSQLSDPAVAARKLRCEAAVAFFGFWLASEAPEKSRLLAESWRLTKGALEGFKQANEGWEFWTTYSLLAVCPDLHLEYEWVPQELEGAIKEAVGYGEHAIECLSLPRDAAPLAAAYVRTAQYLSLFAQRFVAPEEREKYFEEARGYWLKAKELTEEVAYNELSSGGRVGFLDWDVDEELAFRRRALDFGRKARDRYIIGYAFDRMAFDTFWKALGRDDPGEVVDLLKESLDYAEKAKREYSSISFISPRGGRLWTEAPHADYYWTLAYFEVDPKKRISLLEKAVEAAPVFLKQAEYSGYPFILSNAHAIFGWSLLSLAKTETTPKRKKKLLEEAMQHVNESIRINEKIETFEYWNQGVDWNYLAEIKSELAKLAGDLETERRALQDAVKDKESSLNLIMKGIPSVEKISPTTTFARFGGWQYEYGDLLDHLYRLTIEKEHLRNATKAFEDAAESFRKAGHTGRVAECYWKAAQAYDALDEHLTAAESFLLASENYKVASEKTQLKSFYQDYASYMKAWSEIEKAKHHHGRQEYGRAKEYYARASELHSSSDRWNFLAPNYSAWASIENAEDLSRRDQSEEAVFAFQEAAKLFQEGRRSLQAELGRIENPDEKQMVARLIRAADVREEYCTSRTYLEEARIFDRKGDHYSSSEKYALAAETLNKIVQTLESEHSRREVKLIFVLSKAWEAMAKAETKAAPELYLEASKLFEDAKELSPNEKLNVLAMGHSRFCKALEAGTRFADTGEMSLHAAAIQHLESAAKYYLTAGFQKASEYAKASRLLFDAYAFMGQAGKENDQEKKAKLYAMAEKVLQTSASSFTKAEHQGKTELVLRLLDKVREERELALSLTEVFHAPSIVSATTAFSTPTPVHERPVGLERFERAEVQASMITRQKSLKVGENLNLEIELVNAGKGPAQLVKLEELIPEGFELTSKPEAYRVEDSYLNMRGKRLDPLKTEEVKLVLKPKVQGQFTLKPRILYLDENGKYRLHEPEPIDVTVRELGISGWVKGR